MRRPLALSSILGLYLSACGGPMNQGPDSGSGGGFSATGGGSSATGGGSTAIGGGSTATGGGGGSTATGGGGTVGLELGAACQSGSACASGSCVEGVCCSEACTGDCRSCLAARTGGTNGTCANVLNGSVCRPAAGVCDVAEHCSGGVCGGDRFADAGTACRASAGGCDLQENCGGDEPDCPPDSFRPATEICHASTGDCDPAETCTGLGASCPADALADAGTVCRAAVGVCDLSDVCTGTTSTCPSDLKRASGFECRPSAGPCDIPEFCTGSADGCPPVDVFQSSNSLACAPYRCTGTSAICSTSCGSDSSCAPLAKAICTNGSCQTARLVFVTSSQYNPDFGGVDAGDAICQAHARDAGFSGTFLVWMSTPSTSPAQRFNRDGGTYIRLVDKGRVATDWADLTNGISASIGYTEKGTIPAVGTRHVLTGTTATGNFMTLSGGNTNTNCSNWTNATSMFNGAWGQCDAINVGAPSWTANGPTPCQGLVAGRLYCFEQ